jgi:hypothetical protein
VDEKRQKEVNRSRSIIASKCVLPGEISSPPKYKDGFTAPRIPRWTSVPEGLFLRVKVASTYSTN